jgi:hypothetical protein
MTNDREARRRAAEREGELRAEAERGAYAAGEPSRMLFGEWCEAWARSEGPFWRASLRQKRLQRMAVWVEPYLAAERLCDLAEAQLRRWHGEMIQHAGRKGKGHTQVAHAWRDVSAALGAAHRDGLIPRNPALGALPRTRRRAAPPSPRRALTPLEVERIRLHLLNDARDAALVSLLAYCGLRPEEAVALEWASVLDACVSSAPTRTASWGRRRRVPAVGPSPSASPSRTTSNAFGGNTGLMASSSPASAAATGTSGTGERAAGTSPARPETSSCAHRRICGTRSRRSSSRRGGVPSTSPLRSDTPGLASSSTSTRTSSTRPHTRRARRGRQHPPCSPIRCGRVAG